MYSKILTIMLLSALFISGCVQPIALDPRDPIINLHKAEVYMDEPPHHLAHS